jgi:hypothetical protein
MSDRSKFRLDQSNRCGGNNVDVPYDPLTKFWHGEQIMKHAEIPFLQRGALINKNFTW